MTTLASSLTNKIQENNATIETKRNEILTSTLPKVQSILLN